MLLNPCEHPALGQCQASRAPVPGDSSAGFGEARGAEVEVAMATVGSGQLQSTALARLLQHHCQHVAPFLPTTLTLPSPAPRPCQRFLRGFSLFSLSFCTISRSRGVVAQSAELIPETLPGSLSIPSLSQERRREQSRKLFLLGAGSRGQKCGAVNLPAVVISGVSSAHSAALVTALLWWQVIWLLAHLR